MELIKNTKGTAFEGCDFVVRVDGERKIKLLQLTDMQMIDGEQRRRPDRLTAPEIEAWKPENFDVLCGEVYVAGGSFNKNLAHFMYFLSELIVV